MTTATECHSLVLRISDPPDLPVRIWQTAVAANPGEPGATARVRAESRRPIHPGSPPLRAVVLRYADGTADLVLVAVRSVVPAATLRRIAEGTATIAALPDWAPRPVPTGSIDWGLGSAHRAGVIAELPVDAAGRGERRVLGAIALAVSRYGGTELGVLDLADNVIRAHPIDENRSRSVADFLSRFDEEPVPSDRPPAVGVVRSPSFGEGSYLPCQAPVFPLTIHLEQGRATCWFDEGLVDPAIASRFCAQITHLAGQPEDQALRRVELMSAAERADVLRLGGAGPVPPAEGRIDHAVERVAARQPDAVALVAGDRRLTYRQLDDLADEVAAGLRSLGITRGSRIGICLERDAELVITMLGVLKAGCAYVPMDVRYPAERLRFTAENAGMPLVITTLAEFPGPPGMRVSTPGRLREPRGVTDRQAPAEGGDAAYVIYTSGSTGRPKGVVVPHRNVLALLRATTEEFGLCPADSWTLFHSSAFDFSVWEIWGCLLTGGRLVVLPYWVTRDTEEFHAVLAEQRITVLNQTPSAFAELVRADRRARLDLALRLVVLGGEPLDVRMIKPWFARHPPAACRVVNMFGITETTVHVTAQTVTPAEVVAGSRSVGRALPGWSVSIRDELGRLLPPGPAGEIHVGGAGVASHYLGQPELTAQRFVRDDVTGERIYRSGDRGRLRPDGRIDHLGRLDDQVKVRGFRIEPDEIRLVLLGAPGVGAAAVVVNRDDPANSRIDAYVAPAGNVDPALVFAHARGVLPDYMVPSTITPVERIPLTINGKPDVARLPDPRAGSAASAAGPTGEPDGVTDVVLRIWSELLNTRVTLEDNFFTLGGNSLLVVRALDRMRERNLPKISAKQFYGNSTAAQFVQLVLGLMDAG